MNGMVEYIVKRVYGCALFRNSTCLPDTVKPRIKTTPSRGQSGQNCSYNSTVLKCIYGNIIAYGDVAQLRQIVSV